MKRMKFPHRKEQRQKEAIERQEISDARTSAQRLSLIATRPGKSLKEKARLEG